MNMKTQIEAINILAASYETQEKKKLRLAGILASTSTAKPISQAYIGVAIIIIPA